MRILPDTNEMTRIHVDGEMTPEAVNRCSRLFDPPLYLYDEAAIIGQCRKIKKMPSAFGLTVRYAMKANPNRALLQLISGQGLKMEMSSLNEVYRAYLAGIPYSEMLLTSQYTTAPEERQYLMNLIQAGLKYTVCSLKQLEDIADRTCGRPVTLSIRIHPGQGSGESFSRDTGSPYASFGMMGRDLKKAFEIASVASITFERIHVHIGSGSDPDKWMKNVDRTLALVRDHLPDITIVNLGGGYRVKRMPAETEADITRLGNYTKERFISFANKTGRKLQMEIEPGSYIVANSGYLVTRVIDKKQSHLDDLTFIVLNGGMEYNMRPLIYGSEHPFYLLSENGKLLWSDFKSNAVNERLTPCAVVGRCCETGDSQSMDKQGGIAPRYMKEPEIGNIFLIGGVGAYCAAMAPHNYNSYLQAPELLFRCNQHFQLIKQGQSLEQMMMNEMPLSCFN